MEDFLILIVSLGFTGVGLLITKHVWESQLSPYKTGAFIAAMVGENGRHGYDAAVSLGWLVFGVMSLGAAVFNWPIAGTRLGELISSAFIPALLLSMALALSELLFLRPRFLVPPHLREKRGWIPEWIHSMRNRRSR